MKTSFSLCCALGLSEKILQTRSLTRNAMIMHITLPRYQTDSSLGSRAGVDPYSGKVHSLNVHYSRARSGKASVSFGMDFGMNFSMDLGMNLCMKFGMNFRIDFGVNLCGDFRVKNFCGWRELPCEFPREFYLAASSRRHVGINPYTKSIQKIIHYFRCFGAACHASGFSRTVLEGMGRGVG